MTITKILNSVQFIIDSHGQRHAVQIDLEMWDEIVLRLKELDAEPPSARIIEDSQNMPATDDHATVNQPLLKLLKTPPDNDKDERWWDEFEQELRENRLNFPEVNLV